MLIIYGDFGVTEEQRTRSCGEMREVKEDVLMSDITTELL